MACNCRGGPNCCMVAGGRVWSDAFGFVGPLSESLKTVEDFSAGHGHRLPDIDGPRETVIYPDGCSVVPQDDGAWLFTPEVP